MLASILHFLIRPNTLLTVGILILAWLGYSMAFRWTDEKMVARQQAKLFDSLSGKKWDRAGELLSHQYRDQWSFSRADAVLTLKDIGRQFLSVQVTPIDPSFDFKSTAPVARAATRIRIDGHGSPIASQIVSGAHQLKDPFVFFWEQESWHPWSWRLVRIENPGLPDDLYGYTPGDLSRAINEATQELGLDPLPNL